MNVLEHILLVVLPMLQIIVCLVALDTTDDGWDRGLYWILLIFGIACLIVGLAV